MLGGMSVDFTKPTLAAAFAAVSLSLSAAQVYTVPEGEKIYPGYMVEVDGAKAPVSEVRCSAMPFNRRWPGHQRQIGQTELCGMVRFAFDGKARVSVTSARDFKEAKIRPLSRGVALRREGRTVTFDIVRPGGYSVEFDGYHNNLHVFADTAKEYDLPPNATRFGPGEHDIGIRQLKSGDTVYLDPGAVVYGGFHASNATDIAILGRGIIDMSRIKEKILFPATGDGHEAVKNAKRWHTIHLTGCRNVRVDGVTVRDSLCYNLGLWGCEDVAVNNVKIIGQWRFNTDGIDLHNCRRARVTDCFARTFDDTFCFKAHEGYGNCEDCVFERCVAWNDWGKAFEVGVECRAEHLRRLAFRDSDCIHAVSWAMDVSNVDYGRVSDVTFENLRVESDEPMPAMQYQATDDSPFDPKKGLCAPPRLFQGSVHFHHEYSRENGGRWSGGGFVDGVAIRNVSVTTDGRRPLVRMRAIDAEHRPENVVFEDLTVNGAPVSGAGDVEMEVGKDAVPPRFAVMASFAERPVTPEALETLKHSLIHRGDGKGRPDNTMEALLYTWAKGYTPESDIRYTKDGKIVAFHDNSLKKRKISEWLWEELREEDVGSYRGEQYATCRAPLWETIFTAMEENPVRKMHIDWKDVPPEKVAEMVKAHGLEKQCWFITKEYDLIRRYKAALPEGQTLHWMNLGNWKRIDFDKPGETEKCEAFMMSLFEKAAAEDFKDIDNVQLHCQLRYDAAGTPTFCPRPETMKKCVERIHAAGVEASMCVWQEEANRPETYLALWEFGFDSFGTDYPEALYKAVDVLKARVK